MREVIAMLLISPFLIAIFCLVPAFGITGLENSSNNIDVSINQVIKGCTFLREKYENDTGTYTVLCALTMGTIDDLCKNQYYTFCFGNEWERYNKVIDNIKRSNYINASNSSSLNINP